jgi:hypothetical protein
MMQQNKEVPAVVPHIIDASKGSCLLAGCHGRRPIMAKTVLYWTLPYVARQQAAPDADGLTRSPHVSFSERAPAHATTRRALPAPRFLPTHVRHTNPLSLHRGPVPTAQHTSDGSQARHVHAKPLVPGSKVQGQIRKKKLVARYWSGSIRAR